jgi:hypothetical protein
VLDKLSVEGREVLTRLGVLKADGTELLQNCLIFPLIAAENGQPANLYGRRLEASNVQRPSRKALFPSWSTTRHI